MALILDGTNGLSDVDGSAATPAIRGSDANTGVFFGTDIVGVSTGGSERMRVDASGNVGIGTSSPGAKLNVNDGFLQVDIGGTQAIRVGSSDSIVGGSDNNGILQVNTSKALLVYAGGSERARVDSSGNLLVGTTSTIASAKIGVLFNGQIGNGIGMQTTFGSPGTDFIRFLDSGGSTLGEIEQNGASTVAYVTSSDYRLKENIQPMTGALAKVAALKPCTYNWKSNGSDGQGFIAHELQEICPDAVTGEKDGVETYTDEEGVEQTRPKYQGIDTSFLVATLTAAIQEQQAIITALTARVEALEGAQA
jgi:hypothetical protein